MTKGQRKIDLKQFEHALSLIAEKKHVSIDAITAAVTSGAPHVAGTVVTVQEGGIVSRLTVRCDPAL